MATPHNAIQSYWNDFNPNREYPLVDQRIRDTYAHASSARNLHKQYDMYKRFIRWASDRLDENGIIAFVTNRSYLEGRQDDGFRRLVAEEFTSLHVLDLGSDVRRNPKISGTTHNVFGIQTGIAIAFFIRNKSSSGPFTINYASRDDSELATDTLRHLKNAKLTDISFKPISPDHKAYWLKQSDSDFESLIPIVGETEGTFASQNPGIVTARDEWVYGFDSETLFNKVRYFAHTYNAFLDSGNLSFDPVIKWSRNLRRHFLGSRRINLSDKKILASLYRPFVSKWYFADQVMSNDLTKNWYHTFGNDLGRENRVICLCVNDQYSHVLASDKLVDFHFTGDTQCLPLYRYHEDGTRVSNITDWGLQQFRDHYNDESITPEQIFAYTYAVLHDPVYREKYAIDLTRELPRLPFHGDFAEWVTLGQELLDLHIGFELEEPYLLKRVDKALTGRRMGSQPKVLLRVDKDKGIVRLDERTSLENVPESVWDYRLGNRSALEWILDQYKEKTPRDPTIREHFNTYKFADYKEKVIDLLQRVTTVSLRTNEIVDSLAKLSKLIDDS